MALNPQRIKRVFAKNLQCSRELANIAQTCAKNAIPCEEMDSQELDRLCERSGVAHQGIVAILNDVCWLTLPELLQAASTAPLPLVLALDQVQDPHNLGALARSAWALGAAGIILPQHNSAGPGAAAFKSSAGALATLPLCSVTNLARSLDDAEESGFHIFAATSATDPGAESAYSIAWASPLALVLGSEEKGIRPGVLKRCQRRVAIPFARDFNSLNVAQAGTLLMGLCAASLAGNLT